MAKIKNNVAKPHVSRPNVFEPDRFEFESFEAIPDEDMIKLRNELNELTERNGKALERFIMKDNEMFKLILDNMSMEAKLLLRIK